MNSDISVSDLVGKKRNAEREIQEAINEILDELQSSTGVPADRLVLRSHQRKDGSYRIYDAKIEYDLDPLK